MGLTHLISIDDLTLQAISQILNMASKLGREPNNFLKNTTLCNLFYENSTRTRASFENAAIKLGAKVINLDIDKSSAQKGETLLDTINNLKALDINYFVIRHFDSGIHKKLANQVQDIHIINAGDGWNEHPSQALTDAYTISNHFGSIQGLNITIIGDIIHSRVARSNIKLLGKLGANIRLAAPLSLLPSSLSNTKIKLYSNLEQAVENTDVIMCLRLQQERMNNLYIPSLSDYARLYQVNHQTLKYANDRVIILHPGPINRTIEISSDLANSEHSHILQQVNNGILIRQAILLNLENS
ncbi:aspartate carbamoyltransferase catalytic subunit [Rickettsiales endosymbiont of Stachyamoeba lipophora]|uniref:aspartate carbamoyltransferase catalytic subunit n=1 Tax=Rickettsiales endosymbiont of Stachyamoeba lipophora TaxID=2486578 RepID=UPI000F64B7E0|nr:aspartate carbamoyltransferase catalytic subunit [Rickettsiales endosymbiont of Stachyamoeba lipophora]AZL15140.1 aspartate carbamoyltransferase catalytic subunit [Rickettsiales endosymbiont of Stachyamoeba lipophora]